MNILVTGGAGFIGTRLVKRLHSEGHKIIVIDDYSSGKKTNQISGVDYIKSHTSELDFYLEGKSFDVVFHLGEYSRISTSFDDIGRVLSSVEGTFKVIEYCRKNNIKIIYAGSSTKFADEGISHSPYSFFKAKTTDLIKNYGKWYLLKYSICYFYNTFGDGYDSSPIPGYESVISVFEKQYNNNKSLTICGDGLQSRSFTYVEDIVDCLIKSWKYPKNEEFQLSNPKHYTIIEIAKMFKDDIIFIESRKGDRKRSVKNNDNAELLLGWQSTMDVSEWINNIKNNIHNI